MIPKLETERLRMREFRNEDLDVYAAMMADEETVRYIGGKTQTRAEAWRGLAMLMGHWALRGYGWWALEEKTTGAFVGRVGLWNPEGWPGLECGWTIDKRHWGKGYAPEAARVAISYGFLTLPLETIISVIHVENLKSQAVAVKVGEKKLRRETVMGFDCDIWGISRTEWRQVNDL